jgi:hypothetical protein
MAIASLKERLIPPLVIGATSIVSIILICTRNYRNTGGFLRFVEIDRSSTSLIVQILSSVLGLAQIHVATSLFNFVTRIRLLKSSATLGNLYLCTTLSAHKADLSLSLKGFITSAICQGPGALWAGALTPLLTTVARDGGFIQIPIFTNSTRDVWDNQFQLRGVEEPLGRLMDDTIWSLNLLSRMTPSLYESVLGNTLHRNVQPLLARPGINATMTTEEATLRAIADSFTAIIDDILVAFGSAQLALSNASAPTAAVASLPALQVGQDFYIFATAGVNAALLLLVTLEAARTRLWRKFPLFDYTNIKTAIVAASAGRGVIAQEVGFRHSAVGTVWAGDSKDKMVDGIEIQLVQGNATGSVEVVLQTANAVKRKSNQDIDYRTRWSYQSNNVG